MYLRLGEQRVDFDCARVWAGVVLWCMHVRLGERSETSLISVGCGAETHPPVWWEKSWLGERQVDPRSEPSREPSEKASVGWGSARGTLWLVVAPLTGIADTWPPPRFVRFFLGYAVVVSGCMGAAKTHCVLQKNVEKT